MNQPYLICKDTIKEAWINAVEFLKNNSWDYWNLVVHIKDPTLIDCETNSILAEFAKRNKLVTPKGVAYTIFPHKLYKRVNSEDKVYDGYINRIYPWTRTRDHKGWGTYFHRMIHYDNNGQKVNQLKNIINAVNTRERTSRAAYTIVIEKPGGETIRPLGAPCLNYIAVQIEPGTQRRINLLCTYRNHDFLERAYGNYWGLCNLLCFIAVETNSLPGTLTCVSSHAYVPCFKEELISLLEEL